MNNEPVTIKTYSIDNNCIGCGLCAEIAPNIFKYDLDKGFDYVAKQPETKEEEELCIEAMQSCPANAIVTKNIAKATE